MPVGRTFPNTPSMGSESNNRTPTEYRSLANQGPVATQLETSCACLHTDVTRLSAENERLSSECWRLTEETARLRSELKALQATQRQDGFATIGRARLGDLKNIPTESLARFDEDLRALRRFYLSVDDTGLLQARGRMVDLLDRYNVQYVSEARDQNWFTPWDIFNNVKNTEGERIRGAKRNRRFFAMENNNLQPTEALETMIELFRWRGME
jgi:predicted RNase H-like nuclease (RuvC/YqgF family)